MANSNLIVPFTGLKRQYQNLKEELMEAIDSVYRTGLVLDGVFTRRFEDKIAQRCGRRFAVAVNSGTQALVFAQSADSTTLSRNRKVLIPTISFIATLNSVLMARNHPVFCDVDDQALMDLESIDFGLDAAGVETIMYVNLFGNTVDYDKFKVIANFFNRDIEIIEDAAQSFGASYKGRPSGSLGDVSILSFDPTKNLPNYGSGGMLLTDDPRRYEVFMDLRNNGKHTDYIGNDTNRIGTNSKMSESDCAQMLVKLNHFDAWQERRRSIADYYSRELAHEDVDLPETTQDAVHAWHKYVIKMSDRYACGSYLNGRGVETKIHYDQPLHEYDIGISYVDYAKNLYRTSAAFCTECLSLPIYPEMADLEVEYVVESLKDYLKS